jgi:hypothetical protein
MKRLMLVVVGLALVGSFAAGCKKESDTDKALNQLGEAAEQAEKDAAKEAESAKKALDDL